MDNTPDSQTLHSDDPKARTDAARMLGSARTPAKIAAAKAVAESRKGSRLTEEHKEKLRRSQSARRERERLVKLAEAPITDMSAPKRPRGRPKKSEGQQNTVQVEMDSETGS